MDLIIKSLEKYRVLRLILLGLSVFVFILILVLNHFLTPFRWLNTLIVLDDALLLVIAFIFIEIRVAFRYDKIYHNEFIPALLKDINPGFEYVRYPNHEVLGSYHTKIFDPDSNVEAKSVIRFSKNGIPYELYDAIISINTYKSNRIMQFHGYILLFPNRITDKHIFLILSNKKPQISTFKPVKEIKISHYRAYSQNEMKMEKGIYEKLKNLLESQYDEGNKFNIILNSQVLVYKRQWFGFYSKPVFVPFNKNLVRKKEAEFRNIYNYIDRFIQTFEI